MNLVCSVMGHKRASQKSWDGEFYHSKCVRCGAGLVRLSGDREWRKPDDVEKRYFDSMKGGALDAEPEAATAERAASAIGS